MEMNLDIGFGYNDSNFSDRILHILISNDKPTSGSIPDENEEYRKPPCDGQFQNSKGDEASDKNKKICEDGEASNEKDASCKSDDKPTSGFKPEEHEDCRKPVCDEKLPNLNEVSMQNKSRLAIKTSWVWRVAVLSTRKIKLMLGTSLGIDVGLNQAGDEALQQNETSSEIHCSEFQQKSVWVNSLILAAHSPFFRKLFSNGMKESGQQHATIHILASEEDAFMDLLKFMYSRKLLRDTPSGLRGVIMAADKFSVASCTKLCGELLINLPMTIELALLYLDLDLNDLMMDSVRPHLDTAKEFITEHFKDLNKAELQEELLKLPLVAIETVLGSDLLQINSEDDIYDFMLGWVQTNYSGQLEDRRMIINMLVRRFLRFPFLSTGKWECIMSCRDIDSEVSSELALDALRYLKAQLSHQQVTIKVVKRAYTNAIDSSSSHPDCVIYLDLKRADFENILSRVQEKLQTFFVGEHQLSLNVWPDKNKNGIYCFGLYFSSPTASKAVFSIYSDIASMDKSSGEFVRRLKYTFTMHQGVRSTGWSDVFRVSWTTLFSKDSPYFINDVLLLRCDLTIKN